PDPLGGGTAEIARQVPRDAGEPDQRDRADGGYRRDPGRRKALQRPQAAGERSAADRVVDRELQRPRPGQAEKRVGQGQGGRDGQRQPVRSQEGAHQSTLDSPRRVAKPAAINASTTAAATDGSTS